MTQVIDGKVVEMKFDNSDFEKNVAQSLSTLDRLKQALNFDSLTALEDVGKASRSFNLAHVEDAVYTVQAGFSALQVIGITAISEITKEAMKLGATLISNVVNPIKQGGLNRALNIEQAKFQLNGLGIAWEAVAEDIDYAVKGTAYGLDAAAKAAAQLSASNVQVGDSMKKALRGISGVAAMTNTSYEDISRIFTTVAGNGKVMASELNRIGERGLNAAAALVKYFNDVNAGTQEASESVAARIKEVTGGLKVTELEVRDFCSKGKINFEMFAEAMDSAFGEHAKAANNTFTGALANVKAALARIGAKVYTPGLENLRKVFVELIDLIDKFSSSMEKPIDFINSTFESITGNLQTLFKQTDKFEQLYMNISDGLGQALYDLLLILVPIRDGFKSVFPSVTLDNVIEFTAKFKDFLSTLRISQESANNIARIFRGVASIFNIFGMAIESIIEALFPATKGLSSFGAKVLEVLAYVGDWIYVISEVIRQNNLFGLALEHLKGIVTPVFDAIGKGIKFVSDLFKDFVSQKINLSGANGIAKTADNILASVNPLEKAAGIIKFVFGGITTVLSEASPLIGAFAKLIGTALGQIGNGLTQVFSGGGFKTLLSLVNSAFLATIALDIAYFIHHIVGTFSKGLGIINGISTAIYAFANRMKAMTLAVKAGALKDIAIAIGILAASIWVLSTIPADKLVQSLIALSVGFGMLAGMMQMISKIADDWKTMASIFAGSAGFVAIAASFLILAGALKTIASIDAESLNAAMGTMLVLLIELTTVTLILGNNAKRIETGAAAIIAFSVGIRILASAVKTLAKLSPDELITGLQGLTAIMLELVIAVMAISNAKFNAGQAGAIILLSIALNILAAAVKSLGSADYETLSKGLVATAASLAAVAVFLDLVGKYAKNAIGTAASFTIIAIGMTLMADAIEQLGNLRIDQMAIGIIALWAAIMSLVAVFAIFQGMDTGKMVVIAGAMLVLSVAVIALAGAVAILGQIPIENILLGLLGLSVTLIAIGTAGAIFGAASSILLTGALAIAALGAACIVAAVGMGASAIAIELLASALDSLASLGWGDFASAIGMLVISFLALAATSIALLPAIAVLIPLAGALIGIGVAANLLAASLSVAAIGLGMLAGAFKMFETIDPMAIAIGFGVLAGSLGLFALLTPALAPLGAVLLMIGGGFALIGVGAAGVAAAILLLSLAFEHLGPVIESVGQGIATFVATFGAELENIKNAVHNFIVDLLAGFAKLLLDGFLSLASGFTDIAADLLQTLTDIGADMLKALGVPEDWVNVAHDFISGLITGIKDKIAEVIDAVKSVGGAMIDTIRDKIKSHSDSKEAIDVGLDFDGGLATGLLNGKDKVIGAVKNVGQGMITQAQTDANSVINIWDMMGSYGNNYQGVISHKHDPSKNVKEMNELNKEMKDLKNNSRDAKTEVDALALGNDNLAKSAGGAGKAVKEEKSELETLKDTIGNQLDMFSKFEIKTGVTAETMLENMRSNINGFASWSHRMSVLAERFATAGIDQGLYKKLAELGPKGYETMNAFYEMSEEQLAEVKDLWATGLTLPESQADIVNSGFQYMGEMAAQGFSNALDNHKAAHAAAHGLGQAALDGLSESLEVHSPSKATEKIGQYLVEGLARGLDSVYGQGILYFAVKHVSEHILTLFNENLSPEVMGEAGSGILTNLFTGLLGESIEANPIFTAFLETFTNFEPIDEALLLFVEHLKELLYEQFEIEGDGEPSEWFYRYAMSWLQAIINSFIENEVLVRVQIIIFCMHIVETFDEQDLPGFAYDVGMNIALGLKEGIEDYAEEAITAASDMVEAVMEIMAEVPQVESPSKVTRSIGGYISQGLALGIEDGASNVYNAAKTVAEGGIDGMQGEMGRLQDLISTGLDFNPIITPMLDLSYIKQQMSELDYLMNDPEYGIGQNGGDLAAGKTQQINFTQNNYSPKALTRYEIYRQTQNQLSQLKGALG